MITSGIVPFNINDRNKKLLEFFIVNKYFKDGDVIRVPDVSTETLVNSKLSSLDPSLNITIQVG